MADYRIINRSGYDTSDLRRFFDRGMRALRIPPSKRQRTILVLAAPARSRGCAEVGVSGASSSCSGGRCSASSGKGQRMVLALAPPSYANYDDARFMRRLSRLFMHEAAHWTGLMHDDMSEAVLYSLGPTPAWARDLRVRHRRRAPNQLRPAKARAKQRPAHPRSRSRRKEKRS